MRRPPACIRDVVLLSINEVYANDVSEFFMLLPAIPNRRYQI